MKDKMALFRTLLRTTQAVLFDFDGVLADSEEFYYRSYRAGFRKFGHELNREDYWKWWTLRGTGIEGECRRRSLFLSTAQKTSIMASRIRSYSRFCRQGRIRLIPETWTALRLLKKSGLRVAIASNAFPEDLRAIFKANRKNPGVPLVGRMKGLRTKPAPDVFLYAAGLLRAEPARCLVIEDAEKGLDAARACGMTCAIIRTPITRKARFHGADFVFDSPGEFTTCLRESLPA